ncbi:hypothetical protein M430DRAFT_193146 [Amorphotheca resinae ATCC 22711]|uniref:Zn(2)-C6 fungal-type domain-containing protein n=1 Tax=Amorphotheca resinae ATCC 22711 TaxID=857342 RepID=A0A2T3AQ38_AMORE|nr:hypothetical protein M430DRAFT_193146 [Amorphotheca resinae ATCC 22711]PSS07120.1 hypothetical protein M430DRAFT_193146 [Amorphotheca resinae ATCC 22711]
MSNPTSIARTAPIAIASRNPHLHPSVETNSTDGRESGNRTLLSASMSSTASAESGSHLRGRKDRPCDACRRRKSRCVINEGQTSCVLYPQTERMIHKEGLLSRAFLARELRVR